MQSSEKYNYSGIKYRILSGDHLRYFLNKFKYILVEVDKITILEKYKSYKSYKSCHRVAGMNCNTNNNNKYFIRYKFRK